MNNENISKWIYKISWICCIVVAISLFLPGIKLKFWGAYETVTLFELIFDDPSVDLSEYIFYTEDIGIGIIVLFLSFIVSFISGLLFKSTSKIKLRVIMVISAIIGCYTATGIVKSCLYSEYIDIRTIKLIGYNGFILGYKILVLDTLFALALKIYEQKIKEKGLIFNKNTVIESVNNIHFNNNDDIYTICLNCGKENNGNNRFCNYCGSELLGSNNNKKFW